jgi:hypothetical protein
MVTIPENIQKLFVGDLLWVIIDLDSLGMVSQATISGVLFGATSITDTSPDYPINAPEPGVWSPESAQ